MRTVLDDYYALLAAKARKAKPRGFAPRLDLHPSLFGFQEDTVRFLLNVGSGAAFLDTGMGKSIIALEWARHVTDNTWKPVLMLAPLAVGPQHEREAEKFGILNVKYIRTPDQIIGGTNICNYERLHLFDPTQFGGIILDESSILKSFGGRTSSALMEFAGSIPYRLAATATPAPNDHMELGQHSQFLGAMESNEMLARWFVADQSEMGRYRLKRYGVEDFWSWVASWARMGSKPSDLGHDDSGFVLPSLNQKLHYIDTDITVGKGDGELFRKTEMSATSFHAEKRLTAPDRARRVAELIAEEPNETWCVWCDTDYEADAILSCGIPGAVEVRGSHSADEKEARLVAFSRGEERVIITKPSIAGYGLNWQHCARCVFAGLSFSYESFYQAVRRFWRFGQQRQVEVHVVLADTEAPVWRAIQRKATDHAEMKSRMADAMRTAMQEHDTKTVYKPTSIARMPKWLGEQNEANRI